LSAATQAVLAAETGHLDLAYDYLSETALLDLGDLAGNTAHGLHIAALAGAWNGVVAGFGGLRHLSTGLALAPRLPGALTRIAFRLRWRGRCLVVEIARDQAVYRLVYGEDLELRHHGELITVPRDGSTTRPIPALRPVEPVRQPPGREPLARRIHDGRV
jgi:alpha,alpha-trehalose phosphorylase